MVENVNFVFEFTEKQKTTFDWHIFPSHGCIKHFSLVWMFCSRFLKNSLNKIQSVYSDCYLHVMLTISYILKMFIGKTINQNNLKYRENKICKVLPWLPISCKLFKLNLVIKKNLNLVLRRINRDTYIWVLFQKKSKALLRLFFDGKH